MKAATIAVLASVAMAAGLAPASAQDAARPQEGAAAEAGEILDRLGRYLASLEAMEFDCKTISETSGDGLLMRYETRYSVAIRRPASAALRHDGGMVAPTFVTDGATLHIYLPTINKYTKGPAPQRTDDLVSSHADDFGFFEHITQTPGLRTLLSADPVAVIDGVKPLARSMGIEEVDGVRAHRIRVDRSPPGDLWIAAGDTPWLVRAELAADADEWNMGGFWKDVKSSQVLIVSNWRTPDSIPDERFAFAPPAGAEEVDDLMAAMMEDFGFDGGFGMEEGAHALLGEPAPDFEIETLDGPAGALSALSEQGRVVVLDFWATWCPPCREGLPIIAEVMKEYPEDKAVFYAVNVQEDRGAIERFLESQNLKIHVALDGDGAIAQQYGVSGIPQTVIIGKDGAVEAVHVGLSPDLKERLKREVDAVLAGEKLSDAAPGGAGAAIAELPDDENLEALWSVNGPWSALAVDRDTGKIHAITGRGDRMGAISAGGKLLNETRLNGPSSATIRIARLRPDGAATVAFTNPWGRSVEAFDAEGKRLWDYTVGLGVNDIWAADLTGDGLDETIVGYNGATGLHALSRDGELLWKDTSIGNVWHVTAADITGDGRPEVITTSAAGQVHVFSAEGAKLRNLPGPRGMYAWIVRAAPAAEGRPAVLFAGGSGRAGHNRSIGAMDADGSSLWVVDIPGQVVTMSAAPSGAWLAVGCEGGQVLVLSASDGSVAAHRKAGGQRPNLEWLQTDGGETLLIASGRELTAVKVGAE